jgi:hypothetical protein
VYWPCCKPFPLILKPSKRGAWAGQPSCGCMRGLSIMHKFRLFTGPGARRRMLPRPGPTLGRSVYGRHTAYGHGLVNRIRGWLRFGSGCFQGRGYAAECCPAQAPRLDAPYMAGIRLAPTGLCTGKRLVALWLWLFNRAGGTPQNAVPPRPHAWTLRIWPTYSLHPRFFNRIRGWLGLFPCPDPVLVNNTKNRRLNTKRPPGKPGAAFN